MEREREQDVDNEAERESKTNKATDGQMKTGRSRKDLLFYIAIEIDNRMRVIARIWVRVGIVRNEVHLINEAILLVVTECAWWRLMD